MKNPIRLDVLVMGAGPAGCAAAISAAQSGLEVGLAEAAVFPRDRPGEALHPEVTPVFRKLGVLDAVNQADFVRTPGWSLQGMNSSETVLFTGRGRLKFGYLAWRAELDALLLDQARKIGVRILQPTRVTAVSLEKKSADIGLSKVRFRYLVDATGSNGILQRNLELDVKRISPTLVARYGYVYGYPAPGVMPEFHEHRCSWTWLAKVKSDCHQFVQLALEKGVPLPLLPEPYNSISRPRGSDVTWRFVPGCAGREGYFLCGDAASVLDPAASSGVERALASGRKAAELIFRVLNAEIRMDDAADQYRRWNLRQFVKHARLISARYNRLESPPEWISSLESKFLELKLAVDRIPLANQIKADYPVETMATKTAVKKTAAKKASSSTTGKNLAALTKGGVIPKNFEQLSPAEKKAIETLSKTEVASIISAKAKLGRNFSKHAAHGMYF